MSIHEMCRDWDEELMALVPDYRINLLAPASIEDKDFNKFHSSLREVLSFIKYSEDKEKLREHVLSNDSFRKMGRDEVSVSNACVNAGISISEEEENDVDMCKALMDIKEEGIIEGKIKGKAEAILSIGKKHHLTDDEILSDLQSELDISLQEAQEYLDKYEKSKSA